MLIPILSALEACGVRYVNNGARLYAFECPFCGGEAYANSDIGRCMSAVCPLPAYNGATVLRRVLGDAARTHPLVVRAGGLPDNSCDEVLLQKWCEATRMPSPMVGDVVKTRMAKKGADLSMYPLSGCVMRKSTLEDILNASPPIRYEEEALRHLPDIFLAYVVQKHANRIDRILVGGLDNGREFVWHDEPFGVTGLLEAGGFGETTLIASSMQSAIEFSKSLLTPATVLAVHNLPVAEEKWTANGGRSAAVILDRKDLFRLQVVADKTGALSYAVESAEPGAQLRTFENVRRNYIARELNPGDISVSPGARLVFSATGSKTSDVDAIASHLHSVGLRQLAAAVEEMKHYRILYADEVVTAHEETDSYTLTKDGNKAIVATFALEPRRAVVFRERSEIFYKVSVRQAGREWDATISSPAFANPELLQTELGVASLDSEKLPTVVDGAAFKKYITPHLRLRCSELKVTEGTSRLGWNSERTSFRTPAAIIDGEGTRSPGEYVPHPSMPTLRVTFLSDVAIGIPETLTAAGYKLLSMLVTPVARTFFNAPLSPLFFRQTPRAAEVLRAVFRAFGQRAPFEMQHSVRGDVNVNGVFGYPFLVTAFGYARMDKLCLPLVVLGRVGMDVDEGISEEEAENVGRCLLLATHRLAEWCLSQPDSSGYETRASTQLDALAEEGAALLVASGTGDRLLPSQETHLDAFLKEVHRESISVDTDGMVLIPTTQPPSGELLGELLELGVEVVIRDDVLVLSGDVLPLLHRFYGADI